MSEIRINILDANRAVNGTLHASIADAILAGLAAEPETIEEVEEAMTRFARPVGGKPHLDQFLNGVNEAAWDLGIVFVDLAARVFASEASFSFLMPEGEVQFHNGRELTEVWLPYRVHSDWLFLDSVEGYKAVADERRAKRAAIQPIDARPVLYGAITEFVANECRAAREANLKDPVAEIHAKWLVTPRDELGGRPPREILLMKREYIDMDMETREIQWNRLKKPAPCLSKGSHAYRFAGFGTHEIVIYYNLVRMLITDCWNWVSKRRMISIENEIARLERLKAEWLDSPDPEYEGQTPSCLIEYERTRMPWVSPEEDSPLEADCPCCQTMAKARCGPGFWHLDGYSMDEGFEFSFFLTEDEWMVETGLKAPA